MHSFDHRFRSPPPTSGMLGLEAAAFGNPIKDDPSAVRRENGHRGLRIAVLQTPFPKLRESAMVLGKELFLLRAVRSQVVLRLPAVARKQKRVAISQAEEIRHRTVIDRPGPFVAAFVEVVQKLPISKIFGDERVRGVP